MLIRTARRMHLLREHLRRITTDEMLRSASLGHGRLDYPAAEIYLRLGSREEFHRLHSCRKEPWTVRWIEQHLRTGEVLYDVGANIGTYSLVAAKAAPGARVVAFEPSPANFEALNANVSLNELGDQITSLPLALGDRPAVARIGAGTDPPGSSAPLNGPGVTTAAALIERLDDLVDRFRLPLPNHVKIDTDGQELAVIAGGAELLSAPTMRSIMVELDPDTEPEIVRRLGELGLHLDERFTGRDRLPGMPSYGLFLRQ